MFCFQVFQKQFQLVHLKVSYQLVVNLQKYPVISLHANGEARKSAAAAAAHRHNLLFVSSTVAF